MESRQHNESKLLNMVVLDKHVSRRRTIERTKLCSVCGAPVTRKRHSIPVLCNTHRAIEGARRRLEHMTLSEAEQAGLLPELDDAIMEADEFLFASLAAQVDGQEPPLAPMTSPEVDALMQQRVNQRHEQYAQLPPPAHDPYVQDEAIPSVPHSLTGLAFEQARNERSSKIEAARHRMLAKIPPMTGRLPYPEFTGDPDIDFLLMQRTDALNEYEAFVDMEYEAYREQRSLFESISGLNEQLSRKGYPVP